jgi:O-antigen ligase
MGFVLSILYFLTYYLTPSVLFGPLAQYRIELILAAVILFVSIPVLMRSSITKTSQTFAVVGLAFATFMSIWVGEHWAGGGLTALLLFIPNAFAYMLVLVHCNSKRRVQIVILLMLFICLFVIGNGLIELLHGSLPAAGPDQGHTLDNSYFFGMHNQQFQWFYRLRGKGQIDDPNDFAQLIVCTLPLAFFFWKKKAGLRNFFVVLLPVGLLLWGAYLTHSRGSILALLAVLIVALRKRIGTIPSLLLAGLLFAASSALNYTGGRDISASAGEDRTALWGIGLELLKSHPLFGIGFGNMPDYAGQTAHNTIVVCAAELGLCGLFFWSMFFFPSFRDALAVAYPKRSLEETTTVVSDLSLPVSPVGPQIPDEEEIRRLGRLLVLSFVGFIVTGWFLSRAYVLTLFLLGGLTEVTFDMARQRGMLSNRLPFGKVLRYSGMLMAGFILLMYTLLRIVNLTH